MGDSTAREGGFYFKNIEISPIFVPTYKDWIMALAQETKIYKDMYMLLNKILDARKHFPKEFKYAFGDHLFMTALECTELIQAANMSKRDRAAYLSEFAIKFESLQLMIRLCQDRHIISESLAIDILQLSGDIGRQATGWRNASLRGTPTDSRNPYCQGDTE